MNDKQLRGTVLGIRNDVLDSPVVRGINCVSCLEKVEETRKSKLYTDGDSLAIAHLEQLRFDLMNEPVPFVLSDLNQVSLHENKIEYCDEHLLPVQSPSVGNNNVLINSNNTNIAPKAAIACHHEIRYFETHRKHVSKSIERLGACLLLFMLGSVIGYGLLIFVVYNNVKSIDQVKVLYDESMDKLKKIQTEMEFAQDIKLNTTSGRCYASWQTYGKTIAGGQGQGDRLDQLNRPRGLFVDANKTVYIADCFNHRILSWRHNAKYGEIVAGGNGAGYNLNQLTHPTDVVLDSQTDDLLICDRWNQRIVRWSRHPRNDAVIKREGNIVIANTDCWCLTIDKHGSLYVGDPMKHEVRRYDNQNYRKGTMVAGGLNQIDFPISLFVDSNLNLYVSDLEKRRVTKWIKGAPEGIHVAGHHRKSSDAIKLSSPAGIWVDECHNVYAVDAEHDQVMLWKHGMLAGKVIAGSHGRGSAANQLSRPQGLYFDNDGYLYVADQWNHRIQRFSLIE